MENQKVLILDFGGQYNQLIARRVRECSVYCEVKPYDMPLEEIRRFDPIGIIFTGGPGSVYEPGSPHADPGVYELGLPILGICYGCQLLAQELGGQVTAAQTDAAREYGKTPTRFDPSCPLFRGLPEESVTWMSHGDYMARVPEGFRLVARSEACPTVGICDDSRGFYGVQFHPEVNHTEHGREMLRNFLYGICGARGDWTMSDYKREAVEAVRARVGDGKVLLALSGGVDSSVAAALLAEAVGPQLSCVFVDHGLMRKNEGDEVERAFSRWDIRFIRVDAQERFLTRLAGVTEPEQKRKIIGEEFIRVFEQEAKKIGAVDYLAQGTIYPDVIESGKGDAAVIKSHHNVGGLPDCVDFKEILEPLRMLFKDEVRQLGRELGLPEYLVMRQPFPGPGLGIRVIGEITREKLDMLREADFIFRDEVAKAGLAGSMSQYFAALTNMRSVGVMGDGRTYDYAVALRSVQTSDFMTADWSRLPYELLDRVSVRIVNEVRGVNRVLYDITSKPPATVEFE
ncbi:MAG: glutamine-hydrolyzing GMP synthase [Oscillospiraceae bacterium]|nr:glutamine-hydrolyzing GMP synthase [Oscillospiraceae bacterium]